MKGARDSVGVVVLELLRDVPVGVSEAPDAFLVTLAPLGMGVLEPDGVRFPEEGQEESCDSTELEPTNTGILERLVPTPESVGILEAR